MVDLRTRVLIYARAHAHDVTLPAFALGSLLLSAGCKKSAEGAPVPRLKAAAVKPSHRQSRRR
jgi:hypothetical protein